MKIKLDNVKRELSALKDQVKRFRPAMDPEAEAVAVAEDASGRRASSIMAVTKKLDDAAQQLKALKGQVKGARNSMEQLGLNSIESSWGLGKCP